MFSSHLTYLPLALLATCAVADSRPRSVHKSIAKRRSGELAKRYSSARWSFYDAGLGACGQYNSGSDFIVALNAEQFGSGYPGPNCFKKITMTYNGKTATATIMDRCPGCPYGGLDLTRDLFSYFDSQDKGIIYGEWSFVGEGGSAPAPTTSKSSSVWVPPTTSSKAWVAPTTSSKVWVAPTTSSKWVAPTTSSKAWVAPTTSSKVWVPPTTSSKEWVAPTSSSSSVWVPPSSSASPSTTKSKTSSAASSSSTSTSASAKALVASSSAPTSNAIATASATKKSNPAAGNNIVQSVELLANFGQLFLNAGLVNDAAN